MQKSSDVPFRNTLQPLVWSIGSVSGTMTEDQERHLLVATIMDLLRLIQMKNNKDDKVIIAGCLMYVIQQYPRFLRQYYVLLRTVIRKNFDFMHETHPDVGIPHASQKLQGALEPRHYALPGKALEPCHVPVWVQ